MDSFVALVLASVRVVYPAGAQQTLKVRQSLWEISQKSSLFSAASKQTTTHGIGLRTNSEEMYEKRVLKCFANSPPADVYSIVMICFLRHHSDAFSNTYLTLVNQTPLIGYLTGPSSRETLISLY